MRSRHDMLCLACGRGGSSVSSRTEFFDSRPESLALIQLTNSWDALSSKTGTSIGSLRGRSTRCSISPKRAGLSPATAIGRTRSSLSSRVPIQFDKELRAEATLIVKPDRELEDLAEPEPAQDEADEPSAETDPSDEKSSPSRTAKTKA